MGKVIKGSPENPERYVVAVPLFVPPPADADALDDFDGFEPFAAERQPDVAAVPQAAAEPEFDLEAIQTQAQELIDDAARSAESLVDDARERARGIIEEAEQQTQTMFEDAQRQGRDEGYGAGTQSANDEMASMLATMRELLESTRSERHVLVNAAEHELVRLAVAIAERVLHQQIALDNGVVVEMTKAAIARIVDREKITVRVNPADVESMRTHRESLLALGDVKVMRVIEDQRVDRGGVIVETDAGSIDAKISTQLAEVRKILHIVDDLVMQPAPIQSVDDSAFAAARAS